MASNGNVEDLYAGLALPPPSKKKRTATATEEDTKKKPRIGGSSSGVTEQQQSPPAEATAAKPSQEIDVASAIARLKTHMVVDKKFAKAAPLFGTLVKEKLCEDNRLLFLDALNEMISLKASTWSGKREFASLVQLLVERQNVFTESERFVFADWQLLAVTHWELFTDDTFEFARATKRIKQKLTDIAEATATVATTEPESSDQKNQSQSRTKVTVPLLMPLLRTVFSRHSVAWAKPMCESVLSICTRHRLLLFSGSQRDEVDTWTKTIQARRHSSQTPAGGTSAASDARRNIVLVDSAHASQAGVKVGRSNHPLFNREV